MVIIPNGGAHLWILILSRSGRDNGVGRQAPEHINLPTPEGESSGSGRLTCAFRDAARADEDRGSAAEADSKVVRSR